MAVTQTSKIVLQVLGLLASGLDLSTVRDRLTKRYGISLQHGTGDGQANQIWHDQRSIAASANEDLDVAGGLTNALGAVLTFTKIKAIIIKAADANVNNVVVTRPASTGVPLFAAASDAVAVQPGGLLALVLPKTGIAVVGGSSDLINIANSTSGSAVLYDIIIIGVA